jgi:hypothetical protein
MYVVDTGAFFSLGHYYPSRFPTIWSHIDELVRDGEFFSVREVRREIENNCPFKDIEKWVRANRTIFRKPNSEEMKVVAKIFQFKGFLGLVKRSNILRGLPVADPFVVAAGKVHDGIVITREGYRPGGARIPTVCKKFDVDCIDVKEFLERENLQY